MKIVNTFWWLVSFFICLTLCVLFTLALLMWEQISVDQRQVIVFLFRDHFSYVFGAGCVILGAVGFAMDGIYRNYVLPITRLAEETRLIHSVNPSHRIQIEGGRGIQALARVINEGAEQFQALSRDVEQRIEQERGALEDEKNILAAIMTELPEGVIICNTAGKILLYNRRARHLLVAPTETDLFVGLDRSVFRVVAKGLLDHALAHIGFGLERGDMEISANFVMVGKDDRLLRVEVVPILEADRGQAGFVLIIYDITRQLKCDWRSGAALYDLTTEMRRSLANLRTAIETISTYPEMPQVQSHRLIDIVSQESMKLSEILEEKLPGSFSGGASVGWPMATMEAADLLSTLKRSLAGLDPPIELTLETLVREIWIQVDSISLVLGLQFLLEKIRLHKGGSRFRAGLASENNILRIHLSWEGKGLARDDLRQWKGQAMDDVDRPMPLTLGEVLDHHGAEIWGISEPRETGRGKIRLFIPIAERVEQQEGRRVTLIPRSRPEFYDFDLFNQPGQVPELDNRPLSELTYTVFDTETTGLNPKGGDEIIAIGAVRLVNGQLLREEVFDQLVDPRRDLPWESIKIHGIQPEMLQGQPTIDQVLPNFRRFVSDTILVGHNVAFDMRMLQVKEATSKVRFGNPVLDTMLLSAVIHPTQTDHSMEALARRLGIDIQNRHSALGDALTTGALFLRLIPLLAKMNIFTLRQARVASQKTYYARLKF